MNLKAKKADAHLTSRNYFNTDDAQAQQAIAEAPSPFANGVKGCA